MKRKSFGKVNDFLVIPNLVEHAHKSFKEFTDKNIDEVFKNTFPISDHNGTFELQYLSCEMGKPQITPEDAMRKDLDYSAPLKAKFLLHNKDVDNPIESEVFMGDYPYMTDQGTFIFNGTERAIVTQIVKAPGIYFESDINDKGRYEYNAKIVPAPKKGAWIEMGIDAKGLAWAKIDRGRKLPITVFLKAFGVGKVTEEEKEKGITANDKLIEIFGQHPFLMDTLEKDDTTTTEEALISFYRTVRPNDPSVLERAQGYIESTFFDPKKYDLEPVGRYKMNQKLNIRQRALKKTLVQDVGPFKKGEQVTDEVLETLDSNELIAETRNGETVKIIGNGQPKVQQLTTEDITAAVNYLFNLERNVGNVDNIDHLSNRRVRLVGELLKERFHVGVTRIERNIRERMTVNSANITLQDNNTVTPQSLIHIKPLVAAMREFLGGGQLSQYVDQVNPLAELINKRRTSALGPGGLAKERAGVDVRDVNYSHYGRICPIETPEGFGVGLIGSMAIFSQINEYGFFKTPYRKVDPKTGVVTDEVHYLTADDEERYYIAQASDVDQEKQVFKKEKLTVRYGKEYPMINHKEIDYVDVSTKQIVGIGASLIPFLEHDDANRALMGANMQRQGVPLIKSEEPIVGTGIEGQVARDTMSSYVAEDDGIVKSVTNKELIVRYKKGEEVSYKIRKFMRTNDNTSFNHYIKVHPGKKVKKGEVLVDSTSSRDGELAVGKNLLVAFVPWEGYNFEDSILLNSRLSERDEYSTVMVTEHSIDVRDTKLGPEEVTNDVPNVSAKHLENLDENGIVRVGSEVGPDDILIGKNTPKSQDDKTPEEKLLDNIFAEKAKLFKNTSLKLKNGSNGTVIDVVELSKEDTDLPSNVLKRYKVYIAEKRKISKGDKMAGRHGNKGVISRMLPQEDMPHLPDGTPIDIALNPLGVPSRMNIGQIMEAHLGMAGKTLNEKYETPVFNGASVDDIQRELERAGHPTNGKFTLYDGRTGEKFENDVMVGVMYMSKLSHQIDDKLHARADGPYSMVTQQPLGGKAQMGGQRFGEMEVWALEAYGASYALQEMLTLKSDDIVGRSQLFKAIVRGDEHPSPRVPESFKVLINEIRALGLDIDAISENGNSLFQNNGRKTEKPIKNKKVETENVEKDALDHEDMEGEHYQVDIDSEKDIEDPNGNDETGEE